MLSDNADGGVGHGPSEWRTGGADSTFILRSTHRCVRQLRRHALGQHQVGNSFSVTYTFESTAADTLAADSTRGVYAQAISAMLVQIGAASDNMLAFPGSVQVWNDHATEDDQYNASGFISNNVSVLVEFEDATRTAFANDALPTSVNLGAFGVRKFLLTVPTGGSIGGAVGVPEPTAAVMAAAAGLVGVTRSGRRSFRRDNRRF